MSELPAASKNRWRLVMARDFLLISAGGILIAVLISSIKLFDHVLSSSGSGQISEQTIVYCYLIILFSAFLLQSRKGPSSVLQEKTETTPPSPPPRTMDMVEPGSPEEQLRREFNDFSRKTAHDMGNLLTGVMGSISLIRMKLDQDSPLIDVIRDAEKACNQANELTCQLREYAYSLTDSSQERKTIVLKNDEVQGCRILFIDDDRLVGNIGVDICKSLGHKVARADSGEKAVSMFRDAVKNEEPFDLVIADLSLQGPMDGKDAFQTIRDIRPDTKGIITSGDSGSPVMGQYKDHGFHARLMKPFKVQDLGDAINEAFAED